LKLPVQYDRISARKKREVREAYVLEQNGMCYYCHSPLDQVPPADVMEKTVTPALYPPGFFNNLVHLHHSHATGQTLGAVHCYCNAVLWEHVGE
jgi:hypothetical protein